MTVHIILYYYRMNYKSRHEDHSTYIHFKPYTFQINIINDNIIQEETIHKSKWNDLEQFMSYNVKIEEY